MSRRLPRELAAPHLSLRLKPWENQEKIKTLEKKIEDMTAELSKEKDSNASMEAQIDNLLARNGELTRQLAVLQAEVTTLPALPVKTRRGDVIGQTVKKR